jgi:hypothetical protein
MIAVKEGELPIGEGMLAVKERAVAAKEAVILVHCGSPSRQR